MRDFFVCDMTQFTEILRSVLNEAIDAQIGPLKSVIAVKQKDTCEAMGITDDTARSRPRTVTWKSFNGMVPALSILN
jgi:hypothetical protein